MSCKIYTYVVFNHRIKLKKFIASFYYQSEIDVWFGDCCIIELEFNDLNDSVKYFTSKKLDDKQVEVETGDNVEATPDVGVEQRTIEDIREQAERDDRV